MLLRRHTGYMGMIAGIPAKSSFDPRRVLPRILRLPHAPERGHDIRLCRPEAKAPHTSHVQGEKENKESSGSGQSVRASGRKPGTKK